MAIKDLIQNTVKQLDNYIKNWQEMFLVQRNTSMNYFNSLFKKLKGEIDEVRDVIITRKSIGSFYSFFYSSKLYEENKLAFYDAHPVNLYIKNGGGRGKISSNNNYCFMLNWHYVLPVHRAKILKLFILTFQENFFQDKPLLPINYKKIQAILGGKSRYSNFAFKTYIKSRIIKSKGVQALRIPNEDIIKTISMTPAQWVGISDSELKKVVKRVNSGESFYHINKAMLNNK